MAVMPGSPISGFMIELFIAMMARLEIQVV